jgi:hypothetical protein
MFSLKPKYKVFTALLTQNGGSGFVNETSGFLIVGVSYSIDVYNVGDDFSNVGGPGLGQQGEWEGRYFIATATTPNNWSNGSTLIYDEGAPVAIVLDNTIGNIWFTYEAIGSYAGQSNGLFTYNKSTIVIGNAYWETGNGYVASGFDTESVAYIKTRDFNNDVVSSEYLIRTPIEIRVYN